MIDKEYAVWRIALSVKPQAAPRRLDADGDIQPPEMLLRERASASEKCMPLQERWRVFAAMFLD
jgi:hypothetical protein